MDHDRLIAMLPGITEVLSRTLRENLLGVSALDLAADTGADVLTASMFMRQKGKPGVTVSLSIAFATPDDAQEIDGPDDGGRNPTIEIPLPGDAQEGVAHVDAAAERTG